MDTIVRRPRPVRALAWLALTAFVASPLLVAINAQAADRHVHMVAFGYEPQDVEIVPGTRIVWHNHDSNAENPQGAHNVTIDPSNNRGDAPPGGNLYYTFSVNNQTYNYSCRFHADTFQMRGTVKVTSNPSEPSPSVTATITVSPTGGTSPKPKPTKKPTTTPRPTATATPTPTPTPTETPTPTPTETLPFSSPLPTFAGGDTGSGDSNNLGAVAAIVVVVALGGAGYLVYRRFIAGP